MRQSLQSRIAMKCYLIANLLTLNATPSSSRKENIENFFSETFERKNLFDRTKKLGRSFLSFFSIAKS
jgi:hypothetical protein